MFLAGLALKGAVGAFPRVNTRNVTKRRQSIAEHNLIGEKMDGAVAR
jgi:hypothetical protein